MDARKWETLSLQSPFMIQKQKNWKPCLSNLQFRCKSKKLETLSLKSLFQLQKIGNPVPEISYLDAKNLKPLF